MTDILQTIENIKLAVVTGRHPFDVPAFHTLFRSIPGVDYYLQDLENYVADVGKVRMSYDAVVFYNFHQDTPAPGTEWGGSSIRAALEQLGETRQGIMVLHHALLAYKQWPLWTDIVGVGERTFGYHANQTLKVHVDDPMHPITRGVNDWEMIDETYTMADAVPADGNHILLTVDHPLSMRTLAWTRQYRNSRVFCWESGHDGQTFRNPGFISIMTNALRWLAGRV